MNPSQKLRAILFVSSIVITAVLVSICLLHGVRTLLAVIASIFAVIASIFIIMAAKPYATARRIYKERPPIKAYEEISGRDGYCRIGTLPQSLLVAVRCAEDIHFYHHRGLEIDSLFRAVARNLLTSKKPVGASTITQQTIKNVYLTPDAEMQRKLTELFMLRRMERELSKDQILELYLNVIYYGCGQYGIRNAARYYYGTTPEHLTFDQSLSLAAILPCPDKYNEAANPVFFNQRKRKVLSALLSDPVFPLSEITFEP
jgi:membrane peptidoglycan carboxypeptidase